MKKNHIRIYQFISFAFCIFLIIFIISLCYDPFQKFKKLPNDPYATATLKHHKISDKRHIFLQYPTFGKKELDQAIQNQIDTLPIEDGITFISYKSDKILEDYISITYTYQLFDMDERLLKSNNYTRSYNLKTGQPLTIKNTFRKNYMQVLSNLIKKSLPNSKFDFNQMPLYLSKDAVHLLVNNKEVLVNLNQYKDIIRFPFLHPDVTYLQVTRKPNIDPNKPMIAFSFDDGPSAYTMQFMKEFEKYNGSATFFMLGENIIKHPDVVTHMYQSGFEIGNHSWDHQSLSSNDKTFIHKEIYDTQDALFKICGDEPSLYRPPYGAYNDLTLEVTKGMEMALWSIDSLDWQSRDTGKILNEVSSFIKDGSLLLFHDLYPTTLQAIQVLLPRLANQGYQFVTVSDLIKYRNK